jgi:hypothetical protein
MQIQPLPNGNVALRVQGRWNQEVAEECNTPLVALCSSDDVSVQLRLCKGHGDLTVELESSASKKFNTLCNLTEDTGSAALVPAYVSPGYALLELIAVALDPTYQGDYVPVLPRTQCNDAAISKASGEVKDSAYRKAQETERVRHYLKWLAIMGVCICSADTVPVTHAICDTCHIHQR